MISSYLCYLWFETLSLSQEEFLAGYSRCVREFQPLSAMLSQSDGENLLQMHSPRKEQCVGHRGRDPAVQPGWPEPQSQAAAPQSSLQVKPGAGLTVASLREI